MSRRLVSLLVSGLVLVAGCESSPSGPETSFDLGSLSADLAHVRGVPTPPTGALQLTAEQRAQIAALTQAFMEASRADRDALAALHAEARAAHQTGRPAAEIRQILERGRDIHVRLAAAEAKLRADIMAVYTPEQRAWLEQNRPRVCTPAQQPPALSEAQRTQLAAIHAEFRRANQADLALVEAAALAARAAAQAGKSPAEIRQILEAARPAHDRLAAAHQQLQTAIEALLTPEQRATRCVPTGRP
jgi:Spy/CpxP family protein refolding chaperone